MSFGLNVISAGLCCKVLICGKAEAFVDGTHVDCHLVKVFQVKGAEVQFRAHCKFGEGFELVVELFHDLHYFAL
jgi:aerobic-type carbon monoxide dehydrogenase small subunit (CoxS/CutS family)